MANLVILDPAQRELEEIAQLHMNLVGPNAARNITNLILDTLSRLEMFPLSGHIPQDKELRNGGYRYVIAGKYICVYRLIAETVYVYHIAHSASNYPTLFKRLLQETSERRKSIIIARNVFPNRKGVFLFHGGEFYRIRNGPEGPDKNQKQDAVRPDEAAACVFWIGGTCGSAAFLFKQRQYGYDLGDAVHDPCHAPVLSVCPL